jgi:hypothetical protein
LRIGHALVAISALVAGFARSEADISARVIAVVCVSDALGDVLQHLRVYVRVFRVLTLQGWEKHVEGVLGGQRRAVSAVVEQGVIYVSADVEVAL